MGQIKNGKEKSNRAKADLFELLVAKGLAGFYKTNDSFDDEIEEIKNKILKSFDQDESQIKQQLERFNQTKGILEQWLVNERISEVKKVIWVGRDKKSTSDVDLILTNGLIIGVSLKSVGQGLGTQKNIGLSNLKKFLKIEIDDLLLKMWQQIRNEINERTILSNVHQLKNGEIKKLKYDYPEITKVGKKYALPVQEEAINQSVPNFNHLDDQSKCSFLKYIFGIEDNKKILEVIYSDKEIRIFWNDTYNQYIEGKYLKAVFDKNKSYKIVYKDKDLVRIQASFTNGLGLSAFCERAFLTE